MTGDRGQPVMTIGAVEARTHWMPRGSAPAASARRSTATRRPDPSTPSGGSRRCRRRCPRGSTRRRGGGRASGDRPETSASRHRPRGGSRLLNLGDRGDFAQGEHLLRAGRRKQVHDPGDDAGPSGLMAGAQAGAVVTVEVLVEEEEVAPVRILLERGRTAIDRPAPGLRGQRDLPGRSPLAGPPALLRVLPR